MVIRLDLGGKRYRVALMDSLLAGTNGSGSPAAPTTSPDCPLSSLSSDVHAYIHSLEARIVHLESEQKRFMDALVFAGKMLFENPSFKMISMALPKEMKTKLQEFFKSVQL